MQPEMAYHHDDFEAQPRADDVDKACWNELGLPLWPCSLSRSGAVIAAMEA